MSLSADQQANLTKAVELVEKAIEGLGVDVSAVRTKGEGGLHRYSLRRGSANVIVSVLGAAGDDPDGTLRVVAPVVRLPEGGDWKALYEWLLSRNAGELRGAAFALVDGEVVVVAERSLVDLDGSEVVSTFKSVGAAADRYDDVLAERFGTPRSSDA
jgi:hypothetical protein